MLPQPPRHLRIVAHAEPISLIVMLANIFTIHLKPISSAMGPTHGCAYLFVVIATWRFQNTPARPRSWPWFPAPTGSSLCDNFTAVLPPHQDGRRHALMNLVSPILIGVIYCLLMSLIREPHRRRFNAIMVGGA
ncbi:hypothetical protein GA0115242_14752 [Streptomyces sp. SolWspMP-5a-2]|nr:hypothetical protein GA0115242_14752 [Streptomyces sp. SolWspMP-5a-2]